MKIDRTKPIEAVRNVPTSPPARKYLDEAAKAAGWPSWDRVQTFSGDVIGIIAHARTLEEKAALEARLTKYEPPVDPITAEVRECVALALELAGVSPVTAADARSGRTKYSQWEACLRIRISREKEHPIGTNKTPSDDPIIRYK